MPRKVPSTLTFDPLGSYPGSTRAGEQGKDQLESICQALNSTEAPELRDNMRRLVQRWQASGPNLVKMMDEDPELRGDVQGACRARWEPLCSLRKLLRQEAGITEGLLLPQMRQRGYGRDPHSRETGCRTRRQVAPGHCSRAEVDDDPHFPRLETVGVGHGT